MGLVSRLQEIPGVVHATVDLTDSGGGINVRLEAGADEAVVMEKLKELLVAYGVRSPGPPEIQTEIDLPQHLSVGSATQVDVQITPIRGGARVEVATHNVRSFRVVAATPEAIAQGIADAWCQVVGRIPVEVVSVGIGEDGTMTAEISNGEIETSGSADVAAGWEDALTGSIGSALEKLFALDRQKMAVNS